MKIIKFLGLLLLLIVAGVLIAGAFMKKDFHFERSMEMNASKDKVWDYLVRFEQHDKWSQWRELDPGMQVEITGTDGTVGAKMSWKSTHKEVGNGSQTITAIDPGKRIDTELAFEGQGNAKSYYLLEGDSAACKVTWALDMQAPYPMNALMPLMMNEKVMNDMFDKGLGMLKTAVE